MDSPGQPEGKTGVCLDLLSSVAKSTTTNSIFISGETLLCLPCVIGMQKLAENYSRGMERTRIKNQHV